MVKKGVGRDEVSFTGGSRIGWVNATWPLARLTSSAERLTLSTFGTYEFTPQQVVSIDRYGSIPFFANGLFINHNRADYPASLIFWCLGRRSRVIQGIIESGFAPCGREVSRAPGISVRWSIIVAAIALWNLLFFLDTLFNTPASKHEPGAFAFLALLLTFAFAVALPRSDILQRAVLRPGHVVGEIKPFLQLLQPISGLLLAAFSIQYIAHAVGQ